MKDISTFLMFSGAHYGQAMEAINFYVTLFPDSRITTMDMYGPEEPQQQGTVRLAEFTLKGKPYKAIDSLGPHDFNFTPSISFFVNCDSTQEIDHLFAELSKGGQMLMPLDNYGFSPRFGWVNDRFGVSWQVNLPK